MSIRMIARDLYRLGQKVEELEKEMVNACGERRDEMEDRLRKLRAERDRVRKILEGSKEDPICRRPL